MMNAAEAQRAEDKLNSDGLRPSQRGIGYNASKALIKAEFKAYLAETYAGDLSEFQASRLYNFAYADGRLGGYEGIEQAYKYAVGLFVSVAEADAA